jgi:DNA invertase Pin-like site-specific DNA recombinase
MRIALYAGVSTTNGQSPEMQLVEMTEYANRRNFKVVGTYVDEGIRLRRNHDRNSIGSWLMLIDASSTLFSAGR